MLNFMVVLVTVLSFSSAYDYIDELAVRYSHGFFGEFNLTCSDPLEGSSWVISQKRKDYGWGDQTHRAVIILALNNFNNISTEEHEEQLIHHQLEVELSSALLRNETQSMHLSDLALYIRALIFLKKDPRTFYGVDLVNILKDRLDIECYKSTENINVFAILTLVDCRAAEEKHLQILYEILYRQSTGRNQKEMKAIALHALACAVDENPYFYSRYSSYVSDTAHSMARGQKDDGSFGNMYTTSLTIQALIASKYKNSWNEEKSRIFLLSKNGHNVNMVSTYYIESALNANNAVCLKNLYPVKENVMENGLISLRDLKRWPKHHYISYAIRIGEHPDVYFTASMHVPKNATFFDIMRIAAEENEKFRFSWYYDEFSRPVVYSISGMPNNAEESLYWRLVVQSREDQNRMESVAREYVGSPMDLIPVINSHLTYVYLDSFQKMNFVTI